VLLVQEAGGRVSRVDGRPLVLEVPDLLAAATPELHAELGEELRRAGTAL
jgi:fructose-1,6-bisphosphatase/inositol monophosphatase family enzyme